jgi:hypothetical protein
MATDITNIDLITLSGDNKPETWRVPQHIIAAFLANSCMNAAAAVILAQAEAGDGVGVTDNTAGGAAREAGKAVRDRCTTAESAAAAAAAAAAAGNTAINVAAAAAAVTANTANIATDNMENIQRDISGINAGRSTVNVSNLENAKVGIYQYTTAGATPLQITNNTRTGIQAFVYAQTYSNMEKARTGNKVDYNPAIYFNSTTFKILKIAYEATGKCSLPADDFVTIDLSEDLLLSNKTKTTLENIVNIYKTLPEGKTPIIMSKNHPDFYFATRIKLVATIFDVIHNKLTDTGIMNTQSLALIRSAYSNATIPLPGTGLAAAAGAAGGSFVRLFNNFIINGGIESHDFAYKYNASNFSESNNIADTKLFMHYVDATTVGASVPMNEVILTPADKTKYEDFFKQNLLAESIITSSKKGGYKVGGTKRRRRRNRKSSKKNGRGRRYSKRIQKKRGKSRNRRSRRSKRIRRRSHRK